MAFTTITGSGATDATTIVGTSGADATLIQNLDDNVFVGAQAEVDTVDFANYKALVTNYTVKGGSGNDAIGVGATTSFNGAFFNGNAGNDAITLTNASATTIHGGAGNDNGVVALLNGGLFNGNRGNDTFLTNGNVGVASVFGGQGDDNLSTNGGTSTAKVQGNLGNDTISIAGAINATTINGNAGDDSITTTAAALTDWTASTIFGGTGNDAINASANTSTTVGVIMSGDDGNDTLTGCAAADTITTGIGTDTADGRAGNDTITVSTGVDTLNYSEAGVGNVDSVTGFTAGTDLLALDAGVFTVGVGEQVFDLESTNSAVIGAVAAGGLTAISVAQGGGAIDMSGAANQVLFYATGAATFSAACGNTDIQTAALLATNAVLATWYDTDTNEAVIQATFSSPDATSIDQNAGFLEITRIAMAASDYTLANLDASLLTV